MRKGILKCYGLLLALFTIFGLSLSVSSDTNALKYEIEQIPFTTPAVYSGTGISPAFILRFDRDQADYQNLNPVKDYYFSSTQSGSTCQYSSYGNIISKSGWQISASIGVHPDYLNYPSSRVDNCKPFGQFVPQSLFNWDSLPAYTFGTPDLASMRPYWYQYSGLFAKSNSVTEGLHFTSRLDVLELFDDDDFVFDYPNQIHLPLGVPYTDVGQITSGRNIVFSGTFYFDTDDYGADFELNSDMNLSLFYSGYEDNGSGWIGSNHSGSFPCQYSLQDNRVSNPEIAPYEMSYTCIFNSPYDFGLGMVGFSLRFNLPQSPQTGYLWHYPASAFVLEYAYAVTDSDDTLASSPFAPVVNGGDLALAPGAASDYESSSNADFFSSLVNLFTFNFSNPFLPLINLFTANSECVSIPTLASMLHSNEISYCPWFSDTTRNILTPVMSMISVMLVFGFAVRWLGASSGNMFEDSSTHTWGKYKYGKEK